MNQKQIGLIAAIIIIILSFWGGCSIGKRTCPGATVKEVVRYVTKVDTVLVTSAGKTTYVKGKERIVIKSDKQKDSLILVQAAKIANTEKLLDYYRTQLEALQEIGVGEVIESEPPYVEVSGESPSKNDSTLIVRWAVTTLPGSMPDGTKEAPNPRFEVVSTQRQTVQQVDASKPYAIGAGIGAKLALDGSGLDAVPVVYYRKKATVYFGRYYLKEKAGEVGVAREIQFGKRK